jgi:hypothetical protein
MEPADAILLLKDPGGSRRTLRGVPRSEPITRAGTLDQPSHQSASAERERRKHESADLTPYLGVGGSPVVRRLLGQTPNL